MEAVVRCVSEVLFASITIRNPGHVTGVLELMLLNTYIVVRYLKV